MPSAQKKNEWKDIRSRRTNKKTKLAIAVLVLVVGLLAVSWVTRLTQNIFGTRKSYTWNGEFNINLLLRSKSIALFSYNPKGEKLSIINIPDEVFLDVPGGFGKWQLRSIYDFGQSQKGVGGDRLLADSLSDFLAVPVDGFLDFSTDQNQKTPAEIVNALRKNPFSAASLFSGLKTNLTMWELLKLSFGISSVRFDKVKELDLGSLDVLDKENLPDKTLVLTADPVKLDSVLRLTDPVIVEERKSIAVLNATDHPQLANKAARLLTNLGGNVIITANAKVPLKKTQIVGEDSLTLKRLRQIFASDDKISTPGEDLIYQRAQINVLLGEDFFSR